MPRIDVRKGMPSRQLSREEFDRRFRGRFIDPAFDALSSSIQRLADAAWQGYSQSRKSPRTQKAGHGFANPDYDLAIDWIDAAEAIKQAQCDRERSDRRKRILLINGSSRSDQTCPGELSKTWRLCKIAEPILQEE